MSKIEQKKIKMRPKWHFILLMLGLKTVTIGLVFGGAGLLAWTIYLVQLNTPPELLEFGDVGRAVLISDFPYLYLLLTIVVSVAAVVVYEHIGEHYKKKTRIVILLIVGILTLIAILLTLVRVLFGLERYLG